VPPLNSDRPPAPDLSALDQWIAAGGVRAALAEAGEPIENPWRRRAIGVAALP